MMGRLRDLLRLRKYDEAADETVSGLNAAAATETARADEIRRQRRERDFLTARLLPQPESRSEEGKRGTSV